MLRGHKPESTCCRWDPHLWRGSSGGSGARRPHAAWLLWFGGPSWPFSTELLGCVVVLRMVYREMQRPVPPGSGRGAESHQHHSGVSSSKWRQPWEGSLAHQKGQVHRRCTGHPHHCGKHLQCLSQAKWRPHVWSSVQGAGQLQERRKGPP
jgi:hypothetical protein